MSEIKRETTINRNIPIFSFHFIKIIFVLLVLTVIFGCTNNSGDPEEDPNRIYGPFNSTLSPDGEKIIFFWKKGPQGGMSKLATYEIATGKLSRFNLSDNYVYSDPVYSPDGKRIAFIAGKKFACGNVFIMNSDGTNVCQLTYTDSKYPEERGKYNTNKLPNFSPDGRKIIFVRSGTVLKPSMNRQMTSSWDVYEVDIKSGIERRLTNYKFLMIRRPFYMSDGKHFIFSGFGAINSRDVKSKGSSKYEPQYHENNIFIMDGEKNELKPAIQYGDLSKMPSIARNDSMVFVAKTNHIDRDHRADTYDLFTEKKSKIERLTKMQFSGCIPEPFISVNGLRIVFEACKKGSPGPSLWIMNNDGTGLTDINIDLSEFK